MRVTTEEFDRIRALIHQFSGLALTPDKLYLAQSRLLPLVTKHNLASFGELIDQLQGESKNRLRDEFVEAMVTNETSFNRDTHPFEMLRSNLLPKLVNDKLERTRQQGMLFHKMRIWSVAASTGQEPYSIAMAVADFVETAANNNMPPKLTHEHFWIIASDISDRALQIARAGIYSDWEIDRGVSVEQKAKFFTRNHSKWEVISSLKRMVEFRKLNILQNVSDMVGFDLVFCRNLLYYFDEPTRVLVCNKMINSLNPGGILLIGTAEHLPIGWESRLQQQQIGRTIAYIKNALASTKDLPNSLSGTVASNAGGEGSWLRATRACRDMYDFRSRILSAIHTLSAYFQIFCLFRKISHRI